MIGAASTPQTRLPDPSLHMAETRLPWQACRPRPIAPSGAGHTGSCGLPAAAWVLAPAQPGPASLLVTGTWPHQGEDALPSPPPSRPQWVSVGWAVPTSVCGMNDEGAPTSLLVLRPFLLQRGPAGGGDSAPRRMTSTATAASSEILRALYSLYSTFTYVHPLI